MDTVTTARHTGREYLRVSTDRSGRARSVDEQHQDSERAAAHRGVSLGKPYVDNSVSASRYASKARGDFANLMADLQTGRFGADELWLWESSRASRQVGEWDSLIKACERAGVHIYVTTHGRLYDPTNGRDRRSLQEDAVDSEYESSKVSMRSRRAAAANAAEGRPNGRAPYGYRRIYDEHTRRLVRQEAHPDEAPVVREMYDRLRAGHSLRSIAIDFETRGVHTRSGKAFSAPYLRDLVMKPVYVGLRTHNPRGKGQRYDLTGAVPGVWEPLVSEETYYSVRQLLTRPERRTNRPGRGLHLLSYIATCAECGAPLAVTRRAKGKGGNGVDSYQCHAKGCVRVDKADLDDVAVQAMMAFLARPAMVERLRAAAPGDDRLQQVRDELAKVRAELGELRDAVAAGKLSVVNLTLVEPGLLARVNNLEDQERDLATPSSLRALITPGQHAHQDWEAAPMSTRREVARTLLAPEFLGGLQVMRRPRNAGSRHVPADQRVLWHRPWSPTTITAP